MPSAVVVVFRYTTAGGTISRQLVVVRARGKKDDP